MICDSHAHLNHGTAFDADRAAVLARARAAGVEKILNLATGPHDAPGVMASARDHEGVFAAIGIHPHEAGAARDAALASLETLADDPCVIAWGEIGLDYHYLNAPADRQREAFARQLESAARLGLPVSVHTRKAGADTVELIRKHAGEPGGVIHCFTGDWDLASAFLDLGFDLSFSGIITFASAHPLREVARRVPLDRILVETDSPFLAPAPGRGGRNEPARVVEVVHALARLHDLSPEQLARHTTENFKRRFPRMNRRRRGGRGGVLSHDEGVSRRGAFSFFSSSSRAGSKAIRLSKSWSWRRRSKSRKPSPITCRSPL
ncbi:MAG: TatD family hydrolase [Acidobacteriota bacterium]